jgi:hypothetical protein
MNFRPWCAALAACLVVASACRKEEPSRTDTHARGTTPTQPPSTTQPGQQPSTTRPGGVERGTQPATAPRDQTGTTGGTKTDTTKTGDTTKDTSKTQDTTKTGTLTGLDPQVLATRARTMVQDVRMQIEGVDDAQSARQVVTRADPMVDQLLDVRSELKSQNVDVSPLVTAANDAASRLAGNQEALDALKPLLDKVKQLEQP